MRSRTECRVVCFGKVPVAGDFVRGDAASPELGALDRWVQGGLHRCESVLGREWPARFDALPRSRFVWSAAPGAAVIVGWWIASRDAAGRRYPFLVAARIPGIDAASHALLPIACEPFFADARRLLDGAFAGLDAAGVVDAVQALRCAPDLERARDEHASRLASAASSTAWTATTAPEMLLHELEQFAVAAVPPRFGLRWPCRGQAVDVSFWLAVLARFGAPVPRLVLWHDAADRTPGVVRVSLGPPEPRMFPGLVVFDRDDDDAYDPGRGADRTAAARRRFGDVVAQPTQARVLAALHAEVR